MLCEEMNRRALHVRASLESHELNRYGRPWSLEELMLGLIGDVGPNGKGLTLIVTRVQRLFHRRGRISTNQGLTLAVAGV
jgi:hypothetical protein